MDRHVSYELQMQCRHDRQPVRRRQWVRMAITTQVIEAEIEAARLLVICWALRDDDAARPWLGGSHSTTQTYLRVQRVVATKRGRIYTTRRTTVWQEVVA